MPPPPVPTALPPPATPAPERPSLTGVYDHLRRVARRYLRSERAGHTLQATDLVHEAFLRLEGVPLADRAHAAAAGAQAMRRVLVSHARRKLAAVRGGGAPHVPLRLDLDGGDTGPGGRGGPAVPVAEARAAVLVDLDGALTELAALAPRLHETVELRFFGGLSVEETAAVTGRSTASVKRDWRHARAWLYQRLADAAGGP